MNYLSRVTESNNSSPYSTFFVVFIHIISHLSKSKEFSGIAIWPIWNVEKVLAGLQRYSVTCIRSDQGWSLILTVAEILQAKSLQWADSNCIPKFFWLAHLKFENPSKSFIANIFQLFCHTVTHCTACSRDELHFIVEKLLLSDASPW